MKNITQEKLLIRYANQPRDIAKEYAHFSFTAEVMH
jgi:hypothetical protein